MNRRTFMSLAAFLTAPLSLFKGKQTEPVEVFVDDNAMGVKEWTQDDLLRYCEPRHIIIEDAGTFGTLTNGYKFKLAVREVVEDVSTVNFEPVDTSISMICPIHLEGRFLCDPPMNPNVTHKGEVLELEDFEIKSPSITAKLRTYKDGTFRTNGPYTVSEEVAKQLAGGRGDAS